MVNSLALGELPILSWPGRVVGNISLQHHEFNHIKMSAEKNGAPGGPFPVVFSRGNGCFLKEAAEGAAPEVTALFSPLGWLGTPLPRDINQDFCHFSTADCVCSGTVWV